MQIKVITETIKDINERISSLERECVKLRQTRDAILHELGPSQEELDFLTKKLLSYDTTLLVKCEGYWFDITVESDGEELEVIEASPSQENIVGVLRLLQKIQKEIAPLEDVFPLEKSFDLHKKDFHEFIDSTKKKYWHLDIISMIINNI